MYIGLAECIGVMWIYGFDEFAFDLNFMMGRQLNWYSKLTLKYTAPVLVTIVALFPVLRIDTIADVDAKYDYPVLYDVVGWSLTALILSPILVLAVTSLFNQTEGSVREVSKLMESIRCVTVGIDSGYEPCTQNQQTGVL